MVKYDQNSIVNLDPLDQMRLRVGMWISAKGTAAIHHLFNEIMDNSVDEYLEGHGSKIEVFLLDDSTTVTIKDYGRGVPTGMNKKIGMDALTALFTKVFTGGKYDDASYGSDTSGLNGVGTKVTNALSKYMFVESRRNGIATYQSFSKGKPTTKVESKSIDDKTSGTVVTFSPDETILETDTFSAPYLLSRCCQLSSLLPGLEITFFDGTYKSVHKESNKLQSIYDSDVSKNEKLFYFEYDSKEISIKLGYYKTPGNHIKSFMNTINTGDGGSHLQAVIDILSQSLHKLTGKNCGNIVSKGLNLVVSAYFKSPTYRGQSKDKVSDSGVYKMVYGLYTNIFEALKSNKDFIKFMYDMAKSEERVQDEVYINQITNKVKTAARNNQLPDKLVPALNCTVNERELIICEGNSCVGSISRARNPKFQEILPLKGKIINSFKYPLVDVLKNKEVHDIFLAIGGMENTNTSLRCKKVFIMSDADVDGAHIVSLLISLFTVVFPSFIKNHELSVLKPPLFNLISGDIRLYGHDKSKLTEEFKKKYKNKAFEIYRNKGIGEMMAEDLVSVITPTTRVLDRVELDINSVSNMEMLMGFEMDERHSILDGLDA